jgi:hypothetical protein
MQNIVVSDYDKAHVSNGIDHIVCVNLVVSHVHTIVESLQVDNQCSVIYDLFYALIWFIYMIIYTHISNTMHVNKFGNIEINTHDNIISEIGHNPNLCADLIEPHVHTHADYNLDDNLCTLIDPCNVLQPNKLHTIHLTIGTEFFDKRSPTNYLLYTKFDMPIDVNNMLENIFVLTSSTSLNTAHRCKFTFILIGEHVVNTFSVQAICVTNDKLADLKSK